eukprot:GHRQ01027616.1.p1 GENE.GHRQ01027616.1~~GHRQ01027616.1.p1  ORF type:complete len:159 (-),score=23.36 GHRQ01027616.1:916-1392(-)
MPSLAQTRTHQHLGCCMQRGFTQLTSLADTVQEDCRRQLAASMQAHTHRQARQPLDRGPVTYIKRNDAVPASGCACDLDCVVDCLAAAVAVKVLVEERRHDMRQRCIQLQLLRVRPEDVLLCVHNAARLLPHSLHHCWVAVPGGGGADACRTALSECI